MRRDVLALAVGIGVSMVVGQPTTRAAGPVQPEDCPPASCPTPCSGFDELDDTVCWQWALDAAKTPPTGIAAFGEVVGTSGAIYYISDTLVLQNVRDGEINGNGARLVWTGSYVPYVPYYPPPSPPPPPPPPPPTDPTWGTPMFRLEDTQNVRITNLFISSSPANRLEAGIEFTNATNPPQGAIAPSLNIVDHVVIDGTSTNGLDYGIRFSLRYGLDLNNDQSTIRDTAIVDVMKAAISIEHPQSMNHRFFAVSARGASGNEAVCTDESDWDPLGGCVYGASFVRLKGGGFSIRGGAIGNFRNADFYLPLIYAGLTIIDINSEDSAHFIKTPGGYAWFGHPVQVLGGRFSVHQLASDDRIVSWERQGPLAIRGLVVDDAPPGGVPAHKPKFYLHPPPPPPGETTTEGLFQIENVTSFIPQSSTWDLIDAGPHARVVANQNMCQTPNPPDIMGRCAGITSGMSASSGIKFSELMTLEEVPLLDGHWTYCSDCKPHTSECEGEGTGTMARRLAGKWDCEGGVATLSGAQAIAGKTLTSSDLSAATNVFPATLLTMTGTQTVSGKTLTDVSNVFPALGILAFAGNGPGSNNSSFFGPSGSPSATESVVQTPVPPLVVRRLQCRTNASGLTTSKRWDMFLRRGTGSATDVAGPCTLNTTNGSCSLTGLTAAYNGTTELLDLRVTATGNPSGTLTCTASVGF